MVTFRERAKQYTCVCVSKNDFKYESLFVRDMHGYQAELTSRAPLSGHNCSLICPCFTLFQVVQIAKCEMFSLSCSAGLSTSPLIGTASQVPNRIEHISVEPQTLLYT